MKYSFVGMSWPMKAVNSILRKRISEFRRKYPGETPPLEPVGIFSPNVTQAALFAGDNDMEIHYTFFDVLNSSDIIFVFLGDKSLENLSLSFNKYDIKGKILCHASPAFTGDVLNVNSYNTYASMLITSGAEKESADSGFGPLLLEGRGRRFDEFKSSLDFLGIEYHVVTAEEKRVYLTGINFIKDFPPIMEEIGRRLIRMSLAGIPDVRDEIIENVNSCISEITSYNALENDNKDYLNHQKDLMKSIGVESLSRLFEAIVSMKDN